MAKTEIEKRQLKFTSLEEVLTDVHNLQASGYSKRGQWTLGQASGHLANWLSYPIDGFPKTPIFLKPIFWVMKVTMGNSMKKKILAEGFKDGMPTAPVSVPDAETCSDQQGVDQLVAAVAKAQAHNGPLFASPLFGPMDTDTFIKVQLLHAEHHLGYLEPNGN